jgi:nucleotide-binding universal stress UspA family protein
MDMFKKILVPLDGSQLAECALPYVKNLVKEGSAKEVTLLNVLKVDITLGGRGEYNEYVNINALREELLDRSGKYLTEMESQFASEGMNVKTESVEGNYPAETISAYAQKNGVDLIVIATHGYTGLKKLMLGSVALGVLHESRIPVLLIRPESCRAS